MNLMLPKTWVYCLLLLLPFFGCTSPSGEELCLIPQVEHVERRGGTLHVKELKKLYLPAEWKASEPLLVKDLEELAGLSLTASVSDFSDGSLSAASSICVRKGDLKEREAYVLAITEQGIVIEAGERAGMNRAFATLMQLLLHAGVGETGEATLPLLTIHDKPRFAYRGVMIDCSRHFWTVEQLKKEIRQLAFFKLNTLHLHLTDNQGWRLYLEKYLELAAKGSFYKEFPELSGNFYRKSELKELVDYAAAYGVEIIPEVDVPGHCQALLAALPELSCNGGTFEVYPEEQGGENRKRGGENMLCIGNPAVYRFVEDVVEELAGLFSAPYIHLGGDEVSTHIWEECPRCQALYRQQGMSSWHELQDYFTKQVSRMARAHGKTMIGWDEINARNAAAPEDVIMVWQRDGKEQQQKALERGLAVIMSPKDPCYFDFGYSRNSTRRVYEWNPIAEGGDASLTALVKGGQANLWTEFITTPEEVDRMLYPRTCALAETLWSKPEQKAWEEFRRRLEAFGTVFRTLGIHAFVNEDGRLADEERENRGFVPQTEQRPALVRPAHMETNMDGIKYYLPEYAFDGDTRTFFATPYSLEAGSYFTLVLEEAQTIQGVSVVFDLSKEHPESVKLSVSADGTLFDEVSSTGTGGELSAGFGHNREVKAVRIELTAPLMARLSIKEIILL